MTISAVQMGTSSQPQAKASESGFSDVLSEVRTSTPRASSQDTSPSHSEQAEYSETVQVEATYTEETTELTIESFSAEFVHNLKGHISCHFSALKCEDCKDMEENDKVIDALLEILKKMQENSENDPASDLLMELLASMMSNNGTVTAQDIPAFDMSVTVSEISVTTVNTEITAILSAETESMQNIQPQAEANVQQMFTANTEATETDMPVQTENLKNQPVMHNEPATDYEKLLNDILTEARKDLGLTKAEVKTVPEQPMTETQLPVQAKENAGAVLNFNHKDGTNELNSILGIAEEQADAPEAKQEFKPATAVNGAEINLAGNAPQQTEAITAETEIKVEAPLPEQQLADEILSKPETLNGGKTEFVMELNPESLGKITVKLVSTEGRVDVSITAENDSTRQLLEARAENIGTALRQNGVELERYQVVTDREEAQLMQENYDGSSKNPYGRNDESRDDEEHGDEFLEILQQL